MSNFVKAGTRVRIGRITAHANGATARKAAGDEGKTGKIVDEGRIGPDAGWDVYDILLDSGRMTFAHGFELTKAGARKPRKKSPKKPAKKPRARRFADRSDRPVSARSFDPELARMDKIASDTRVEKDWRPRPASRRPASRRPATDIFANIGPGKFDSAATKMMYELSLDGADDECGESGTTGWYGLVKGPFNHPQLRQYAGAILEEDSQGFVVSEFYISETGLMETWDKIVDEVSSAEGGGE